MVQCFNFCMMFVVHLDISSIFLCLLAASSRLRFFFPHLCQTHVFQSFWLIIYMTLIFRVNWMSNLIKKKQKETEVHFLKRPTTQYKKVTAKYKNHINIQKIEQQTVRKLKEVNVVLTTMINCCI